MIKGNIRFYCLKQNKGNGKNTYIDYLKLEHQESMERGTTALCKVRIDIFATILVKIKYSWISS